MTRDEWVEVCGKALAAEGIDEFHPLELADVGRKAPETVLYNTHHLVAPPFNLIPNAIKLCHVLCDLRKAVRPAPVLVNSWYRDTIYNHRIGGAVRSMHLTCGAADVTKIGFTPAEVADILERHPDSDRFGLGRYATFTHIDIRGYLNRSSPARWGP